VPFIVLDDVAPAAPWGVGFAITGWAHAVAGGAAVAPVILMDHSEVSAARLRAAWSVGLAATLGAIAARIAGMGLPGRIPAAVAEAVGAAGANLRAPLSWGALAGVILVAAQVTGLALGRRRGAGGAVAVGAALAGIALATSPAAALAAAPSRDLFLGVGVWLGQALTAVLGASALLLAVAGRREGPGERLATSVSRVLVVSLAVALAAAFFEGSPVREANPALAQKARRALLGRDLWVLFLGLGLGAGTALPLVAASWRRLALGAAIVAVLGRLAIDVATARAGLAMLGA